jgi:hypothetical protein
VLQDAQSARACQVIRHADGMRGGGPSVWNGILFAEETRYESPLVCNLDDVVCFRVVICPGCSGAKADGSPPISCSPITPATSESRRASSLRIVTQNLECDVQERMQRVSAPLNQHASSMEHRGVAPFGIGARGTARVLVDLADASAPAFV